MVKAAFAKASAPAKKMEACNVGLPYHTKDYPLLWDESYNKKQAYTGFLTGLQLK